MAIPENAPHPDASYAWFNYLLQGDLSWLTLVDYPYTSPNAAALAYAKASQTEVYDAYMASAVTNTPAVEFTKGHEVKDLGVALSLYDEIWTEIKR